MKKLILLLLVMGCSPEMDALHRLGIAKEDCEKFQQRYEEVKASTVQELDKKIVDKVEECKKLGAWK